MDRLNIRLTSEQVHKLTGLFHVATEAALTSILKDGISAGIICPLPEKVAMTSEC
jgi:hypothetical protein